LQTSEGVKNNLREISEELNFIIWFLLTLYISWFKKQTVDKIKLIKIIILF